MRVKINHILMASQFLLAELLESRLTLTQG